MAAAVVSGHPGAVLALIGFGVNVFGGGAAARVVPAAFADGEERAVKRVLSWPGVMTAALTMIVPAALWEGTMSGPRQAGAAFRGVIANVPEGMRFVESPKAKFLWISLSIPTAKAPSR
ncbi:MAG: hypothetical protein M5R36_13070 [Deltaproteobacteria bacterium]|nr:hypothetical protein [Deltaproteobacteria bacterium]